MTLAAAPDGVAVQEVDAGGRPARWLVPDGAPDTSAVLHLHGGGFAVGALGAHVALAGHLAAAAGRRVLALDYRLAPEHPHPAALDDAQAAHAWLQEQGLTAGIALSGESAAAGWPSRCCCACATRAPRCRSARRCCAPGSTSGADAAWRAPGGSDDGEAVLRREALALAARLYAGDHAGRRPVGLPRPRGPAGAAAPPRPARRRRAPARRRRGLRRARAGRPASRSSSTRSRGCGTSSSPRLGEFPEADAAVARVGAFLRARLRAG